MSSARAGMLAILFGALGCAIPDPNATTVTSCPDRAAFTSVSPFLEAGCGTLDCHGARPRPLRIFGSIGLRLAPTDRAGGNPTTVPEVDANWRSVCGLEPEIMADVTAGRDAPDALLLVQKPRDEAHHKGGAVVKKGDDGDRCVTGWLAGDADPDACSRAAAAEQH